jgi:hypothetical protein
VAEFEPLGVEIEARRLEGGGAILPVTHHGMARFGGMDANLVFSPCLQSESHGGIPRPLLDDFIMGDGQFSLRRGVDEAVVLLDQVAPPRSGCWQNLSLEKGKVAAGDCVGLKLGLQARTGRRRIGEDHDTRRLPVEPVDRIDHPPFLALENGVGRPFVLSLRGNAQEARGFVNDDQIAVFVEDLNPLLQEVPSGA